MAARNDADKLNMTFFEQAKDKILMGPERKTLVMGEKEKKTTAYHEAGHALVALNVKGADPVHKISIIPRGMALGVTILLPEEDRVTMSKEQAEGIIAYAMGGRAAEEIIFGHYTTGAGDDIKKATDIARKMVCNWGMSEKIGPVALGRQNEEVFLGRDMGQSRPYSEQMAQDIDEEVRRILNDNYSNAVEILKSNDQTLERMADALLVRETLGSKDIELIVKGEDIVTSEERRVYKEAKESQERDRQSYRMSSKIKTDEPPPSPPADEPVTT